MGVFDILETTIIFLISIAVFLGVFIGILYLVQKKMRRKTFVISKRNESEIILKRKSQSLSNLDLPPENILSALDNLTRKFFTETFKIKRGLDYSEICGFFEKNGKKSLAIYCNNMTEALYSGEKITKQKVYTLQKSLEKLINTAITPEIKAIQREHKNTQVKELPVSQFKIRREPSIRVKHTDLNTKAKTGKRKIIEIYTVKEPKNQNNINTIDNLDRIKVKIDNLSQIRKFKILSEK